MKNGKEATKRKVMYFKNEEGDWSYKVQNLLGGMLYVFQQHQMVFKCSRKILSFITLTLFECWLCCLVFTSC
jgi:hypothetical protein